MEDFVLIGVIRKVRGIKGELKVESMSDVPSRFRDLDSVFVRDTDGLPAHQYRVEKCSPVNDYVVMKLHGVDSYSDAEGLVGSQVLVHESERARLPEGSFYIDSLIGASVVDSVEKVVGTVVDVLSDRQKLLVIRREDGFEFSLPFVKEFVKHIDVDRKLMKVELIDGIMDGGTDED